MGDALRSVFHQFLRSVAVVIGHGLLVGTLAVFLAGYPFPVNAQTVQRRSTSSKVPDLSGNWVGDFLVQSISAADPEGKMRGKEPDISYQAWALKKTLSEYPATGPDGSYEKTTDPWVNYCEPPALWRTYIQPARFKFVQTPDAVYILHELLQEFRIVRLNSEHPKDPDPKWWGDSIGWYENGDTLVVDSVGFNDLTWLDQIGHPHSEQLHYVERYKRLNVNTLSLEVTVDDPGAYTKPFSTRRTLTTAKTPFMQNDWVCSVRENNHHKEELSLPAATTPAK